MSNDFNEFLVRKQTEKENSLSSFDERKYKHVDEILKLYKIIKDWLQEYENKKFVEINEIMSSFVNEDITELRLNFNGEVIVLTPDYKDYNNDYLTRVKIKKTNMSNDNSHYIILEDEQWNIQPQSKFGFNNYQKLNKESFLNLLQKLL